MTKAEGTSTAATQDFSPYTHIKHSSQNQTKMWKTWAFPGDNAKA